MTMFEIVVIWVHIFRVWLCERVIALGIGIMPFDSPEQNKMRNSFNEYKDWKDLP